MTRLVTCLQPEPHTQLFGGARHPPPPHTGKSPSHTPRAGMQKATRAHFNSPLGKLQSTTTVTTERIQLPTRIGKGREGWSLDQWAGGEGRAVRPRKKSVPMQVWGQPSLFRIVYSAAPAHGHPPVPSNRFTTARICPVTAFPTVSNCRAPGLHTPPHQPPPPRASQARACL